MADKAIVAFLDSLRAIPNDEKSSYLEAFERCPQLLQHESCISRFLSQERGHTANAARRFTYYWDKRKKVFGDSRAFLQMTLANGALQQSCLALMRTGWIQLPPSDSQRTPICYLDMTIEEIRHDEYLEDRLACLFYAMQILSEDPVTQKKGFILLVHYDEFCHEPYSTIDGLEEILRAMPLRVAELYLVKRTAVKEQSDFFEFTAKTLKTLLSSNDVEHSKVLDDCQHVYIDRKPHEILKDMVARGLRREHLPLKLGGSWTLMHHTLWLSSRLEKEAKSTQKGLLMLPRIEFPSHLSTTSTSLPFAQRNRLREARHSRHKRDRRRCREKSLFIAFRYLEKKKKEAQKINANLLKHLEDAKKIVSLAQHSQVEQTSTLWSNLPSTKYPGEEDQQASILSNLPTAAANDAYASAVSSLSIPVQTYSAVPAGSFAVPANGPVFVVVPTGSTTSHISLPVVERAVPVHLNHALLSQTASLQPSVLLPQRDSLTVAQPFQHPLSIESLLLTTGNPRAVFQGYPPPVEYLNFRGLPTHR